MEEHVKYIENMIIQEYILNKKILFNERFYVMPQNC